MPHLIAFSCRTKHAGMGVSHATSKNFAAPPGIGAFVFQIAQEAKFLWHSYELEDGGGGREREEREAEREEWRVGEARGEIGGTSLPLPSLLNCVGAILLLFLLPS